MNAERLLELYDNISEAPDAVERLRRFVLDLAVRGKLVGQDPTDEPASELLQRAALKKATLEKEAAIRKQKRLAKPAGEECWFSVPRDWIWVRLMEIGHTQTGTSPSSSKPELFGDHIPFIKPADLDGVSINYEGPGLSREGVEQSRVALSNSVMMVCIGATLGKTNITSRRVCFNQQINSLTPFIEGSHRFVALALKSTDFQRRAWAKAGTGTLPIISKGKWEVLPIPLPPLAEQHRIVAKVDELMGLCDRLEEARKEREETRDRLTTASLARLTAPDMTQALSGKVETGFPSDDAQTDDSDFPAHAAFALNALPALTTRPDQIKSLRQTILNLAVRGKLVEQDPADEPGTALLSRIHEKKKEDVQPQEMRRAEKFSVEENDFPYEVPKNWAWAALRQLSYNLGDGLHGTPSYVADGQIYFVNGTNLRDGKIQIFENTKRVSKEEWQKHAKPLGERSMLVSINGTLKNYAFYNGEQVLLGKSACYFELSPLVDMGFIRLLVQSPYYTDYATTRATGTTIRNLSLKAMNSLPVPIPPLAEQHRIVAKVDELMALCDQLEAALIKTDTTRTRLLEALLHEALEPSSNNKGTVE